MKKHQQWIKIITNLTKLALFSWIVSQNFDFFDWLPVLIGSMLMSVAPSTVICKNTETRNIFTPNYEIFAPCCKKKHEKLF